VPVWLLIVGGVFGGLFAIKIMYLVATAGVLPMTQGALFVGTSQKRVDAFLDHTPMKPGQVLYDLGCGDGRVLRAAAKRYGVRAVGFEVNPMAWVLARIRTFGLRGVKVKFRDFRRTDLDRADVVFCYLFPDVMKSIVGKLEAELKPGARVASANFPISSWQPEAIVRPGTGRHADPIYFYQRP
jgi:SAM-dependent methyltransferase